MSGRVIATPAEAPDRLRRLFSPIAAQRREVAVFAYFDPKWRFLGARYACSRSALDAAVPLRAVAADVLALDASIAVMAHNHPSGDARFSADDLALTRRIHRGLATLDVALFDHWLLTRERWTSLRAEGGI